jgi:hypothetical protein
MVTTNTDSNILSTEKKIKFGDRIEFIIEKKGISKLWLAEQLGITKQALNYLIKHSCKPKYIDEMANIMQANPRWIEFGDGLPFHAEIHPEITGNVNKLRIHNSKSVLSELRGEEQAGEYESIDYTDCNINNFVAYRIQNDSVFPPFLEKTVLIFDKKKQPSNGDYVLLIKTQDNSVLVRQYSTDGSDVYFNAKNKTYKNLINKEATIIGVLVEARYLL